MADDAKQSDDRSVVKTLLKGLELLDVVASANRPMSVSEIATAFDMDIGTVHRFLNTFVRKRYIGQDPNSKQYFLGAKVLQLGRMFYEQHRIYDVARDLMFELSGSVEETVQFSVYSAIPCAILVDEIKGVDATSVSYAIGTQLPMHSTAAGKVMLAMHEAPLRERIIKKLEFDAHTKQTIRSKKKLIEQFEEIEKNGWAEESSEFTDGVHAIAAPIFNVHDQPVAAISIHCPEFRCDKKRLHGYAKELCRIAASISEKLGHLAD